MLAGRGEGAVERGPSRRFLTSQTFFQEAQPMQASHQDTPPGPCPTTQLGLREPGLALASLLVLSASWNVCLEGHDQDQERFVIRKGQSWTKGHGGRAAATRHCWAEGAHAPCVPGHPSSQLSPSFRLFFPRFVCVWPCPLLSWALPQGSLKGDRDKSEGQLLGLWRGLPGARRGMTPPEVLPPPNPYLQRRKQVGPRWLSSEEPACSTEDPGSSPGWRDPPGGGHGNPLQ